MSRPEDNIPAMVAALTLADVRDNNTVLVLIRQGWRAMEIAAVIDEVERQVIERHEPRAGKATLGAAIMFAGALFADPVLAAEAAAAPEPWVTSGYVLTFYLLLAAWAGAFFGFVTASILAAGREDTYPVVIKRGRHYPCRLAVRESGIICLECSADAPDGVIPPCSMGEWSR